MRCIALVICCLFCMLTTRADAATAPYDLAKNAHVSNSDIAASLVRNGASQSFAQAAANLSSKMENRAGDLGLYNGSCCTGVLQVNQGGLKVYCGCTKEQYAAMTLDQQTAVWLKLTYANMGAPSVKQLKGMSTFDGQPVDDALILACVQLGPGSFSANTGCARMIASGRCSGFSDSNGTSPCKMAQAIRGGSASIGRTNEPATPTANTAGDGPDAAIQDPNTRAINADSIPMGNPVYCWSCDVIIYAMATAESAIVSGLPAFLDVSYHLLGISAILGILWRILVAITAGFDPIRYAAPTALRAAVILTVLSHGGGTLLNITKDSLLIPALNGSARLGQYVATNLATNFGLAIDTITPVQGAATTPVNDNCTFNSAGLTLRYLQDAEGAILSLACTIHKAMTTEVQIGIYLANSQKNVTTGTQQAAAAAITVCGLIMAAIGMIGMLKFGLIFLDIMISLGVAVAFTPWALYCWIFDSLRDSFGTYWRRFLHLGFACLVTSIGAVISLVLLLTAMQTGLGMSGTLSPNEILINAQQIVQQMDQSDANSMGLGLTFLLYTVAGALAANHILSQSAFVASAITGLQLSTSLSNALMTAMSSVVSISGGLGAGAAGMLASPIGRAAGALTARHRSQ